MATNGYSETKEMTSGDALRQLARELRDDCVEMAKASERLGPLSRPLAALPPSTATGFKAAVSGPTLAEWHETIADLLRQSREELRRAREYVERAEL